MMVKEGGFGALAAVLFGGLGLVLGVVALALLPLSRRAAHTVGVITLFFALLAPAAGVLGMAAGRRATDGALLGVSVGPGAKARIRHEGYRESQSAARLGFFAALAPLLLGATAALLGARRKLEDPPGAARFVVAGIACGLASVTAGGAFAAGHGPLPPDMDRAEADLLDARARVDWEPGVGCDELDRALREHFWRPADPTEWPRRFSPDPRAVVPDLDAVATRCMRDRMAPGAVLSDLLRSPLLVDDALHEELSRRTVERAAPVDVTTGATGIAAVAGGGTGAPAGRLGTHPVATPTLRAGAVGVSGRLPPEVIQRIVRQNFGRFRLCYEDGLRRNPALEGKVTARFVIDKSGAVSTVSDGGSDLPDAAAVACVLRGFGNLSFPQPEGGIVVVTFPLAFKAGT